MDKDVANIEEELKRLSVIANALNRSLVLPPIHCTSGKHKYCNLCTFDSPHCFSSTISSFKQPVKESVFFTLWRRIGITQSSLSSRTAKTIHHTRVLFLRMQRIVMKYGAFLVRAELTRVSSVKG